MIYLNRRQEIVTLHLLTLAAVVMAVSALVGFLLGATLSDVQTPRQSQAVTAPSAPIVREPETSLAEQNRQFVQQLLYNTPRAGSLGTAWDDYVASISWADYKAKTMLPAPPPAMTDCGFAC